MSSYNITFEIIKENPDEDWNWDYVSLNPNITMEIIESNPNIEWCWKGISSNPNITTEFIEKNIDYIDFYRLSDNIFTRIKQPTKKAGMCNLVYNFIALFAKSLKN